MRKATMNLRIFLAGILAVLVLYLPVGAAENDEPAVSIVVAPSADPLERFAAKELQRYLKRLFNVEAEIETKLVRRNHVFNVGVVKKVLSDQGILLRPDGNTLTVGGGSPRAVLWAVYELAEHWGVRYLLDRDVFPEKSGPMRFPDEEILLEPTLRIRQWRVVNDFAMGPESWGMADYRPVLDQLAKLKFNRILVSIWVWQPFLHLEYKGIARQSAYLWFNYRYPITPDMPGRHLFGDAKEFWNPDLPPRGVPYADFVSAGQQLVHSLIGYAHNRGMDCALTAHITEFPPEFAPLVPNAQKVQQLGAMTVVPGAATAPDDPTLTKISKAVLRATINTYPEADYIALGMPEWRQWTDRYEQAWDQLDKKYDISKIRSLAEVLAGAENRTSYPGGAERAVREVKGDIIALSYYDRILQNRDVLRGTRRPDVRFIFSNVSEELFPVLGTILPPGSEALNFVDYTASRIVRRREVLRQVPGKSIPTSLIYTLHDDNVGMLPQLVTGSLHELTQDLRRYGWAGFSTRYWLIGDHDACLAYLSKAAWDPETTPEKRYRDQVWAVCGNAAVEDMLTMFKIVERVTIALEDHALGLTFPVPGMMTKHLQPGPLPATLAADRESYHQARSAAKRALKKCNQTGRPYIQYWIGRLTFGVGYLDCIEATRRIATAEAKAKRAEANADPATARRKWKEAVTRAEKAVRIAREMLEAYAEVARDQSDRGAIATLVEYVYRPLKAKAKFLKKHNERSAMMRWNTCCMSSVLWFILSPAVIVHAAPPLKAGFAAVDVTPNAKEQVVWLAGLALNRRATGMHDPLYARAAVLDDGRKKIALVAVDSIGLMYPSVQRVRAALDSIDYVLVASTHTHEGPDVVGIWGPSRSKSGVDQAYLFQLETGIVQAVRKAGANMSPAKARYGTAEDRALLKDYRLPHVYDPVLRTVLFERISNGKPCGAIVQWNSHMIEPGKNTLITCDSAGVTVDTLESRLGCRVVYFSGAVGGLMGTPDQMFLDKFGEAAREKPFECIAMYGRLVADLAHKALRTAKEIPLTPMVVSTRPIALPLDNPGFRQLLAGGVLKRPVYAPGKSAEDIGAAVPPERTDERLTLQSEVAYLRLGDLHIATIPGEIYPELVYGQYPSRAEPGVDYPSAPLEPHVMGMLPGKHAMLLGLANDAIGYIIPKRQWDTNPPYAYNRNSPQYGEVNSLGPETAGVLLEALRRRVAEARSK